MVQRTCLGYWRGWKASQRLGATFAIAVMFLLVLFLPLVTDSSPVDASKETSWPFTTMSSIVVISKTASAQFVAPGQTLAYTLTVRNTSATSSTVSLLVTDTIPANTFFDSVGFIYPGGGSVVIPPIGGTGVITWDPTSELTPTGLLQLIFRVQVASGIADGTIITNAAYGVSEAQSGVVMGGPVTVTVMAPALAVSKQADRSQVCGNQRMAYTLTVTNTGHLTSSGPIRIMDHVPSSTVYAMSSPGGSFDLASRLITWTLAGPVTPGQAMTVTFAVTNPAGTLYGAALVNDMLSAAAPDVPGAALGVPVTVTAVNLKASFTNTSPLKMGQPVTFYNTSTGATGYTWNFGDGSRPLTVTNPAHTFTITGSFGVVLTATGPCGTDIASKTLTVISPTTPMTTVVYLPAVMRNYPRVVGFGQSAYSVSESASAATVTVALSQASSVTVTVDYSTTNGTATAGADYTATHGTLVFGPGQTAKMFGVGIMSDTLEEGNETIILTLRNPNPSDTVLGLSEATLMILDDDHPVPSCAPQVWYTATSQFSPMDMAYDVATDRLFVANRDGPDGGSLSVINARSGVTTHVVTGVLSARGVAFDAARNLIYVVGWDWLNVVDGMTYAVTKTLRLGTDVDAYAAAFNPVNGKLYISGFNSHKIMIVNVANWSVTRIDHTNTYPLSHPSYVAVNPITRKAYVTNHPGTAPSWVTVIDGDTDQIVNSIYLSGDLYGITADSVHNRVYVASISAARLYAVDGATDTSIGDIIIVRALDNRPVPLRMVAVNPSVGGNLHIWLTGSSGDWRGMDRLILLSGSDWQHLGQPRATGVAPSPEDGLVVDPMSWNVFASSAASNLVTVSHDNATLCSTPLSFNEVEEPLYTIVNDYGLREGDR